jgi:hypothetical protein
MERVKLNPDMTVNEVATLAQQHLISLHEYEEWCNTLAPERKFEGTCEGVDRYFQGVKHRENARLT